MPHEQATDGRGTIVVGPDCRLDINTVARVAFNTDYRFALTDQSKEQMQRSCLALNELIKRGEPIYGINTGFGPLALYDCPRDQQENQGLALIAHLTAGTGDAAPAPMVRATMFVRAWTIAQGVSGASPDVVEMLLNMVAKGVCPFVPLIGSVGASGDLVPLSHIAMVMAGQGRIVSGNASTRSKSLGDFGLRPLSLRPRDALALVNGTSFTAAIAALAAYHAQQLVRRAEQFAGWIYRALGCRASALDPRLHQQRGHPHQIISAQNIHQEAARYGDWQTPSRPLQEPYSIRCTPQVLGACRQNIDFAARIVTTELNGVSDNPVICADPAAVLHGGNFHGQQLAFAADALNAALTQIGVLAERQIALLCDPRYTDGGSLLLAPQPGPTSGLAGAQLTATAALTQMRHQAAPCAFASIPTNGGNQDIVPMSTHAAIHTYQQTELLCTILAVLNMALVQLQFLHRRDGQAQNNHPSPPWAADFEPLSGDRPLHEDIRRMAHLLLNSEVEQEAPSD